MADHLRRFAPSTSRPSVRRGVPTLALALASAACTAPPRLPAPPPNHPASEWAPETRRAPLAVSLTGSGGAGERRDVTARASVEADEDVAREVAALLAAPLDETSAVRMALLNNPHLRASYRSLGVALADRIQAGLLSNPRLSVGATLLANGPAGDAALSGSVLDVFLRPLREARADFMLELAKAQVESDGIALVFDVRRELARVRAATAEREIRSQALDVALSSQRLMVDLHRAGNVTDQREAMEDAAVARARLDLATLDRDLREAREDLISRLGLWGPSAASAEVADAPLVEVADEVDLDHVEGPAIAASQQLAMARAMLDVLSQDGALIEVLSRFPGLDLGVLFGRGPGGRTSLGPALTAELPLFDRGEARQARVDAMQQMQEDRYQAEAIETRSAARRRRDRLVEARARFDFVEQVLLPAERRVVHEEVLLYNAMQVGAFDVLARRLRELEVESERIDAQLDRTLAGLDLLELLAGSRRDERHVGERTGPLRASRFPSAESKKH